MKKRILAASLVATMVIGMLVGCQGNSESGSSAESGNNGNVKAVLSLGNASDYYIGTMVGAEVQSAFEEAGAKVQIIDGADDVNNQVNQIQNAIISKPDVIYIFPAGDGPSYADVLKSAKDAGVKTLMSNNYPGDGLADVYVGNDEFQMGVMMSAMVSKWADETYPDAGAEEVSVLICESTFNENAIRRCLGMRLIGEKFLRKCDTSTIYYQKEEGEPVNYLDENGKEVAVDEPTGGLILDEKGYAQLNPYYNEKIKLVEYSNRNTAGTDATEAQKALENAITMGEKDLSAVMSYGDVGAALDTKVRELCSASRITTDLDKMAVFCSDLTDTNRDLIISSKDNTSVLRGVMASGNLVETLKKDAQALVNGEDVPAYTMMSLSYDMLNEACDDVDSTSYDDCPQLPETETFFE